MTFMKTFRLRPRTASHCPDGSGLKITSAQYDANRHIERNGMKQVFFTSWESNSLGTRSRSFGVE